MSHSHTHTHTNHVLPHRHMHKLDMHKLALFNKFTHAHKSDHALAQVRSCACTSPTMHVQPVGCSFLFGASCGLGVLVPPTSVPLPGAYGELKMVRPSPRSSHCRLSVVHVACTCLLLLFLLGMPCLQFSFKSASHTLIRSCLHQRTHAHRPALVCIEHMPCKSFSCQIDIDPLPRIYPL